MLKICLWFVFPQHKEELLPYVRDLQNMNLKLYGSTGTADFYSTKGILVSMKL